MAITHLGIIADGNRRWANVDSNVTHTQAAPLLWFFATNSQLQVIFVSASYASPDDNQLS